MTTANRPQRPFTSLRMTLPEVLRQLEPYNRRHLWAAFHPEGSRPRPLPKLTAPNAPPEPTS